MTNQSDVRKGTLVGIRIVEFAGLGPGPFCGMMLADHGADVIRVDRIGDQRAPSDVLGRSRRSVALNVKDPEGVRLARELCKTADGLIEGFRPGVMERLGLGPDALLKDNPGLVYGRMTGWGQTGPYANAAGHDINYIALSGALHTCGRRGEKPTPPVNYLGDFGGGGMLLAFGMLAGLLAVKNGGPGQVIDCAMTDGSALLSTLIHGLLSVGAWKDEPGVNLIDTGAHFYDVYETGDRKWISVGSIEPQFYSVLLEKTGLREDPDFAQQYDASRWSALKEKLAGVFKTKTRDEWCAILAETDACYAPVLSLTEAPEHVHNAARNTFVDVDGVRQPAPAPRFSKDEPEAPKGPPPLGENTDDVLQQLGVDLSEIADLRARGIIG